VPRLEFRILGPLEVRRDGTPLVIPSQRQRALLALLVLRANQVVPADELIEQLWHPTPPAAAKASLHNHVSRLRGLIGREVVETVQPGYRLSIEPGQVDLLTVEAMLAEAQSQEGEQRARTLRLALDAWRGLPLIEFPLGPAAQAEAIRLEELRLFALEERIEADLELNRFAPLVPELEALVAQHPLRERLWRQLMRALYGAGRQAEALATYRRAHRVLVSELGVEPGQALKDLQLAILLHEPRLTVTDTSTDDLFRRAVGQLPVADSARGRALLDYAQAIWRLGERTRATLALEEAAARAAAGGDTILAQRVVLQQGLHEMLTRAGDLLEQVDLARQASATFERSGDLDGLAEALLHESYMLRDSGSAETAATLAERAYVVAATSGNDDIRRRARGYVVTALALGPAPVAEALARCPPTEEATYGVLCGRGYLEVQAGNLEEGLELIERGIELAEHLRLPSPLAGAMHWAAFAHEALGDAEQIAGCLQRAYDLNQAVDERSSLAVSAARLARALASLGEVDTARYLADEAVTLAQPSDLAAIVYTRLAFALIEHRVGNRAEARSAAQEAVAVTRQSDWLNLQAFALEHLSVVAPNGGAAREARRLYERKGNASSARRL